MDQAGVASISARTALFTKDITFSVQIGTFVVKRNTRPVQILHQWDTTSDHSNTTLAFLVSVSNNTMVQFVLLFKGWASNRSKMHHHDALAFLPHTPVLSFPKGRDIYNQSGRPSRLYLVLSGTVKLNCTASDGSQTLIRIVPPEGFFGESSLIPQTEPMRETAISVNSHSVDELER